MNRVALTFVCFWSLLYNALKKGVKILLSFLLILFSIYLFFHYVLRFCKYLSIFWFLNHKLWWLLFNLSISVVMQLHDNDSL
jgi:hypothetical protein